jgi:hypothetical protein
MRTMGDDARNVGPDLLGACNAGNAVEAGHGHEYIRQAIDGDGVPPKLLERADDSYRFVTAVGRLFATCPAAGFFVLAGHRRGDP